MRLHLILNLPGRNGSATQFVICDHEAETIEDFCAALNEDDHIVVAGLDTENGVLVPGSLMSLNQAVVAKATEYHQRWSR
jgi:hypothetical protein